MRYGLRLVVAAIIALAPLSTPAAAGLFRAYVSASGNDATDCTLGRPCRLLPKALAAVADGGEVWIVDSGNFNVGQVNVDKSVTILAVPSAQGSLVATGGADALFVNTPGVKVTLRHLIVVPFAAGALDGVGFAQGAELNVFDCDISGMQQSGIAAYDVAAKVTVSGTTLRGNGNGVYARGPVVASLDHVQSLGNTNGVFADAGSVITVTNSVIAHNSSVGAIAQSGAVGAQLVVRGSSIVDQPQGLFASGNNTAKAVIVTSANTFVNDLIPFAFAGSLATIVTMQNNDAAFYMHLTTPGYALTPNGSAI
jgi:hypothetical protein